MKESTVHVVDCSCFRNLRFHIRFGVLFMLCYVIIQGGMNANTENRGY